MKQLLTILALVAVSCTTQDIKPDVFSITYEKTQWSEKIRVQTLIPIQQVGDLYMNGVEIRGWCMDSLERESLVAHRNVRVEGIDKAVFVLHYYIEQEGTLLWKEKVQTKTWHR